MSAEPAAYVPDPLLSRLVGVRLIPSVRPGLCPVAVRRTFCGHAGAELRCVAGRRDGSSLITARSPCIRASARSWALRSRCSPASQINSGCAGDPEKTHSTTSAEVAGSTSDGDRLRHLGLFGRARRGAGRRPAAGIASASTAPTPSTIAPTISAGRMPSTNVWPRRVAADRREDRAEHRDAEHRAELAQRVRRARRDALQRRPARSRWSAARSARRTGPCPAPASTNGGHQVRVRQVRAATHGGEPARCRPSAAAGRARRSGGRRCGR